MESAVCTNHPTNDAARRCARCLRPFCEHCLVMLGGRHYCGECKFEQVRDAQSGVSTVTLPTASLGRRFAALIIDGFVVGIPLMIPLFAFAFQAIFQEKRVPMWFNFIGLIQVPIFFLYEGLMTRRSGQTVGKKVMAIRIVSADGTPITQGQAWGRAGIRGIMVSCLALANYLPAFLNNEKMALHDMAARTRVVSTQ